MRGKLTLDSTQSWHICCSVVPVVSWCLHSEVMRWVPAYVGHCVGVVNIVCVCARAVTAQGSPPSQAFPPVVQPSSAAQLRQPAVDDERVGSLGQRGAGQWSECVTALPAAPEEQHTGREQTSVMHLLKCEHWESTPGPFLQPALTAISVLMCSTSWASRSRFTTGLFLMCLA